MRPHTSTLAEVIKDSHSRKLFVEVFHGPERVMPGLELTDWELEWDLTREVKFAGSATVVYESVSGESLTPDGTEGILSPFKARLLLTMEVSAGAFTERITLGWARVDGSPRGQDYYADTIYGRVVVASVVEITFLGLEENVRRRGFRAPEQPRALTSVYTELRRITGMTVVPTVPDAAIPAAVVYEATRGGRLKAVQDLWGVLGCTGVITPAGQWVGVPNAAGAPVGELALGEQGTVLDIGSEIETDEVYNCVVGSFEDADRNPIFVTAEETSGPLATNGPYGENTLYYSSPLVTTWTAADKTVKAILTQSIGGQLYQVPIQCLINPVAELGDVLTVSGWDRPLQGRLIKVRMGVGASMEATLEVQRSLT